MSGVDDRYARWREALDRGGEVARQARGEICVWTWRLVEKKAQWDLHKRPWVCRWEETGDLQQELNLRLIRVLDAGVRPETEAHLVHLAAQVVGRLLIDLTRKHRGPEGWGA